MSNTVHVAITRRVKSENIQDFERLLAKFVSQSLNIPGSRGVHLLYPPPGADLQEYGILRSFASAADRDAFYTSKLYRDWLAQVAPLIEGGPIFRELHGLETWFRDEHFADPPVWKMALLTFIAVWPVSMAIPAILNPWLGKIAPALFAGAVALGIVLVLTWVAMPLLVKLARPWLQSNSAN